MQPEAVIFDIGNVLTRWQPEAFYDRVIGEERRRALFAEVDLHHMNDLVDTGHLFKETIYDWADRTPHWRSEIRMWYDRWIELASPRIEGSIALQRALRAKGIPVAYVPFEGEQHGFRRAESIVRALESELWFYGRVFGFEPADRLAPVDGAVGL